MISKPNILVVEDDHGARESLRMILKQDFNVLVAENAPLALQILDKQDVDAITLEPRLRGLQGRELLALLRCKNPEVPIILVTGHRLSTWFDDMIRDEIFDYIPKPFDAEQLRVAVGKSVRLRLARPACL